MGAGLDINDGAKIVIRGVLDQIEEENSTENKAALIKRALDKLCNGTWNVITYPSYESRAGHTSSCFHWRNKQWIYAEQTINTPFNENEIESFMNTEFGWAPIADVNMVQQSAETKINAKFPGTWRVHVVKLTNRFTSMLYGATWEKHGYTFFIHRTV